MLAFKAGPPSPELPFWPLPAKSETVHVAENAGEQQRKIKNLSNGRACIGASAWFSFHRDSKRSAFPVAIQKKAPPFESRGNRSRFPTCTVGNDNTSRYVVRHGRLRPRAQTGGEARVTSERGNR